MSCSLLFRHPFNGDSIPAGACAELRHSEARFRATFENAAVGIAHVAPDGTWLRANKRLYEITGYSPEELRCKTIQDITHPADLEANFALIQRALAGEIDNFSLEKRYLRRDGLTVWVRLTVGCVRTAEGAVDYFIGVVEDISEKKSAEIALRESEERFRALANASSNVRYRMSPDASEMREADGQGLVEDTKEPTQNWLAKYVPPGEQPRVQQAIREALAAKGTFDLEHRVRLADGTLGWIRSRAVPILEENGDIREWFGSAIDITDRKRAEEALRASEERLRLALDAAQLGTWHWEIAKGIEGGQLDARCRELLGVPPGSSMTPETWTGAIPPEDWFKMNAEVLRALDPASPSDDYACEYRVKHPDGTLLWLSATGRAFFEPNPSSLAGRRPISMAGTLRDVTQARRAEAVRCEQERRNRYLLELEKRLRAAGTAHQAAGSACALLGEELGATLAVLGEIEPDGGFVVESAWSAGTNSTPLAGRHRLAELGTDWAARINDGETVTVTHVGSDPRTAEDEAAQAAYRTLGIRSSLGLPLMSHGKPQSVLLVADAAPRDWTGAEAALARETLASAWQTLEKAKADAIRQSEEWLRHLGDSLPDSAVYRYAHEPDGMPRFYYISAGIERLAGVRVADVLRDAGVLLRQILPEYLPLLSEAEQRSARELSDFKMELPMRRPDGEVRWVRLRSRPQSLQDGSVIWEGIHTDITEHRRAREALRKSREDLGRAQAVACIGSWRLDIGRNEIACSAETFRIFGFSPDAPVTYEVFLAAVYPDDRERVNRDWTAALAGAPYDIEFRIVAAGKTKWVRARGEREFDPAGRFVGYVGTTQDITDKRWAEEALRESEERLRLANDAAGIGTFTIDVESGYADYSPELAAMLGFPDIKTSRIEEALTRVHRDDFSFAWKKFQAGLSEAGDGKIKADFRFVCPSGEIRWMTWTARLECRNGPSGRIPFRIAGACVDITELKRAEEALRESEARLRLALNAADLGTWRYDAVKDTREWDTRCKALYGLPPGAEISREIWLNAILPEDRAKAEASIARALDPADPHDDYACEYRVKQPNGAVLWLSSSGRAFFEPDRASSPGRRPLFMAGTIRDVTEARFRETTRREREKRQRYFLKLENRLQHANTASEALGVACEALGSELGASFAAIGELEPDGEHMVAENAWSAGSLPRPRGRQRLPASSATGSARFLSGCTVTVSDAAIDPHTAGEDAAQAYRALGIRSSLAAPVMRDGRVRALLFVADAAPRTWTQSETQLSRKTLERVWHAVERTRAEEALRKSEERFRGVFEHAGTGIAISDVEGWFKSCNPAFSAMLGYNNEELRRMNLLDIQHPDDLGPVLEGAQRLVADEIPFFETSSRYLRKGGKPIWVRKNVSLLRDAAGGATNIIALVTDITEERQHAEHVRMLMREVNHRSKNLLALVAAIARQTVAAKPEDFLQRFGERIEALAASQDLLVKNAFKGANLHDLVRSQLAHFQDLIGRRIELQGPPLFVCASAAQALGMALHELATNAGKYGALSNEQGRVEVAWHLAGQGDKTFTISWRERGGPPVTAPSRRGFGSTIICTLAETSLDATVELHYPAEGFAWRLQCPLLEVIDGSRAA